MVFYRRVSDFDKKGNPQTVHAMKTLKAEMAALRGQFLQAVKHYKDAIVTAGRQGRINDQNLANELLADFYLGVDLECDAVYHLRIALNLYEEWGAGTKCEMLRKQHAKLLSPPSETSLPAP